MRPEKLVHMANQIGSFFATQKKLDAGTEIADHIRKFWDPRMRAAICAYLHEGGEGLTPEATAAIKIIDAERTAQAGS